jgi:hypothetical protein
LIAPCDSPCSCKSHKGGETFDGFLLRVFVDIVGEIFRYEACEIPAKRQAASNARRFMLWPVP